MSETRYEFVRQFDLLPNSFSGWLTELNLLSFGDREPGELQSVVTWVEMLQGRMGESTQQAEELFESMLAERLGGNQ